LLHTNPARRLDYSFTAGTAVIVIMSDPRRYILQKRAIAISDLSSRPASEGDIAIAALHENFRVNGPVMVGIGTSVEVGLEADRYPYVVQIHGSADVGPLGSPKKSEGKGDTEEARLARAQTYAENADTVTMAGYFPLVNAAGDLYVYTQRPSRDALHAGKLIKLFPALTRLGFIYSAAQIAKKKAGPGIDVTNTDVIRWSEIMMAAVTMANPSAEVFAAAEVACTELCVHFSKGGAAPHVQVSANMMVRLCPYGRSATIYATDGSVLTPDEIIQHEYLATMHVNAMQMTARYVDDDGNETARPSLIKVCASAIAQAHVQGMMEVGTKREFHTLACVPMGAGRVMVRGVHMRSNAEPEYAVGDIIDINGARTSSLQMDLAAAMVFNAGLMHYQYNHSTGGELLSGPALSTLSMYNLFDRTDALPAARGALAPVSHVTGKSQTRLCYEAMHPISKRAVANIFFSDSQVYTWGRQAFGVVMRKFEADAFISLRSAPRPAGSHKAYLAILALQRVLDSHLAVFLPWANEIDTLVTSATRVLSGGARAHIGSHYYTGEPPVVQSSDLDRYMPDLAAYIQTMAAGDTLAMSPHLSLEVSARASQAWQGILRQCKGEDYSTVSAERIKEFLKMSGKAALAFDTEKPDTWAQTIEGINAAARNVRAALGM